VRFIDRFSHTLLYRCRI